MRMFPLFIRRLTPGIRRDPTQHKARQRRRSNPVLGEVVRPFIAGKLAAEGFPLCGREGGVLVPVMESVISIVSYCSNLTMRRQ